MSARRIRREHARRAKRAGLATGTALAATIALAPAAQGATFTVDSTADAPADGCDPGACTLRDAITVADADAVADTITFAPSVTGTITLTQGALAIGGAADLTITGPGADVLTVSGDADGSDGPTAGDSRVFTISAPSATTMRAISDLTIADGYASGTAPGGAIYATSGSLSLEDVVVSGSRAINRGGALSFGGGTLSIIDSELTGNEAGSSGGAIEVVAASELEITDSIISGNSSGSGGGAIDTTEKYFTGGAEIDGTKISDNEATDSGGGIQTAGPLSLSGVTIADNTAGQAGGGIAAGNKYGALNVEESTITGNSALTGGGGIDVTTNEYTKYCPPIAPGCTPKYLGSNSNSDTVVSSTTISENSSDGGPGGGIRVRELGSDDSFRLASSTVADNDALWGGGVALVGPNESTARVQNSTITGNSADHNGGGIDLGLAGGTSSPNSGPGAFSVYNSTVAANTAGDAGGGVFLEHFTPDSGTTYESGGATLYSTIVGDNLVAGAPDDIATAAVTASPSGELQIGYSLIEEPGTARYADSPTGSNLIDQDPRLLPLADNGGPTETLLPANVSPALDVGANPLALATDQRGLARDTDLPKSPDPTTTHTDMGAVELQGFTAPETKIDSGPAATGAPADVSFTFSADQPGSTFECSLDGSAFAACTSPKAYTGLGGGEHTFRVRAVSEGATDPTPATATFAVGGGTGPGAPETTLTKKPRKKVKTRKGRAKVKLAFASSEPGSTFECKIDKGAFKPCASPLKVKLKAKAKKGAKHTIAVRAVNSAGEVDPTPASVKVKVIRKKPKKAGKQG